MAYFPPTGSVVAFQGGTRITSVVSTVPSSVIVGASIFGTAPVTQGGTWIASVFGNFSVVGNVPVTQATSPWVITSSIAGGLLPIAGSVAATITNTNVNVSGSIVAFQGTNPWVIGSIVGTYSEDAAHTSADKGLFTLGVRNDTVSSFTSADLEYTPKGTDSAGRTLVKHFAPDEARFSYNGSVVSTSVTLIAASVIGKRAYITDFWISNTGPSTGLVTFQDGSTSVVGYTVAPANGGSNSQGIAMPPRTAISQDLAFSVSPASSIVYVTINGYQAP